MSDLDDNEVFKKGEKEWWSEKFEKVSVNWVDKELLELILGSLDISNSQFTRFVKDHTKWLSKINTKTKQTNKYFNVSYENIRTAADFLGIPPWLLFYKNAIFEGETSNFNEKIIDMFNKTPPKLPIIKIVSKNGEAKKHYGAKKHHVQSPYKNEETKPPNFFIWKNIGENGLEHISTIKGDWKLIFEFLEDNYNELPFSGCALLYSEKADDYLQLGTLVNVKLELTVFHK